MLEFGELGLGADTVGEVDGKAAHAFNNLKDIYVSSGGCSGCDDCESNDVDSNVLDLVGAGISGICAESAAIGLARGAVLPADRAVA